MIDIVGVKSHPLASRAVVIDVIHQDYTFAWSECRTDNERGQIGCYFALNLKNHPATPHLHYRVGQTPPPHIQAFDLLHFLA